MLKPCRLMHCAQTVSREQRSIGTSTQIWWWLLPADQLHLRVPNKKTFGTTSLMSCSWWWLWFAWVWLSVLLQVPWVWYAAPSAPKWKNGRGRGKAHKAHPVAPRVRILNLWMTKRNVGEPFRATSFSLRRAWSGTVCRSVHKGGLLVRCKVGGPVPTALVLPFVRAR